MIRIVKNVKLIHLILTSLIVFSTLSCARGEKVDLNDENKMPLDNISRFTNDEQLKFYIRTFEGVPTFFNSVSYFNKYKTLVEDYIENRKILRDAIPNFGHSRKQYEASIRKLGNEYSEERTQIRNRHNENQIDDIIILNFGTIKASIYRANLSEAKYILGRLEIFNNSKIDFFNKLFKLNADQLKEKYGVIWGSSTTELNLGYFDMDFSDRLTAHMEGQKLTKIIYKGYIH